MIFTVGFYLLILFNVIFLINRLQLNVNQQILHYLGILYIFIIQLFNDLLTPAIKNIYYIFILFLFLLIANIVGLLPFVYTITTHLSITLTCAVIGFLPSNIIGIYKYSFRFLEIFLPSGTSIFLIPLVTLIEIVTYFSRILSLAIRLFANMVAGHTLLKILAGFVITIILINNVFSNFAILLILFLFIIFYLEILIVFLQAYIFIVLCLIYLNDINIVLKH